MNEIEMTVSEVWANFAMIIDSQTLIRPVDSQSTLEDQKADIE
jgi:hypothetical protein